MRAGALPSDVRAETTCRGHHEVPEPTLPSAAKARWRPRLELQVESMSGFAVRVFLYTWYAVLLIGLVAQAYNVELQWEAREFCGADRVSLDMLSAWNSSQCMEAQKYWAPVEAHPFLRSTTSAGAVDAFSWIDAPPLASLFPSGALPTEDAAPVLSVWAESTRVTWTVPTSTTDVPKPTMRPLRKRYAIRWTSAKVFSHLLDRRVNRFTHVLLSLASPMANITDPDVPEGVEPGAKEDRAAVRYRRYFLRVALEEEPFDPSADSDSAPNSTDNETKAAPYSCFPTTLSPSLSLSSFPAPSSDHSSHGDSSTSSGGGDSGSASGGGPTHWHYVYNASITCYVDQPRCSTLVLPRSVAVLTSRNESRFSLTLLDVEPELALASATPSAIGVWYQRGFYTLGTLIWRCVFLVYTILSCTRFVYRSRRGSGEEKRTGRVSWSYEQCSIWALQLSFMCYLDPLFVPGVFEWRGIPAAVYHFLEFHFPNYFVAMLLCFCFGMSVACGQRPSPAVAVAGSVQTVASVSLLTRFEDERCHRRPPPYWVYLATTVYITVVLVLDVSQSFFEDWVWDTEAICEDKICRGLRVGLNVVLISGFVIVFFTLWWLRARLATLLYLDTRPQQLLGRMLIFILSSSVLYLVAISVMMTARHSQLLDLVYFQPLTQLGPMVVATVLVNHLMYLFTPIAASSRVPIRPSNPMWKLVRWSSRWFQWLDMHGGSLYIFATEEEERRFMAIQLQHAYPRSHSHGYHYQGHVSPADVAASSRRSRRHGTNRASSEPRDASTSRPYLARRTASADEASPVLNDVHAHGDNSSGGGGVTSLDAPQLSAYSSRLPSHADSLMAGTASASFASTPSPHASTRSSVATATPSFPTPATAAPLGTSVAETRSPDLARTHEDHAQRPGQAQDHHDANPRSRAYTHHRPRSPAIAGAGGVLSSIFHTAEHTLIDGTGQLMDMVEDALVERPLYAALHGRRHRSGATSSASLSKALARVEARRHYFFNVETAIDCFNMAWEAYAVTASDGDALVETGLRVNPLAAPDAVLSGMERFLLWLFTRLFNWKRQYDDGVAPQPQQGPEADDNTRENDGNNTPHCGTATAVPILTQRGFPQEPVAVPADLVTATPPRQVHRGGEDAHPVSKTSGVTDTVKNACERSREDTRSSPAAFCLTATPSDQKTDDAHPSRCVSTPSAATSPVPRPRTLNPGLYGHQLLAVIEMVGVQVVVTTLDHSVRAQAGKTPRLVVSFRGTDNATNALQNIRFHQRAWREMPERLLTVRPTVHSGFLEMWMQLKERVLSAVVDALQRDYLFVPYPESSTSSAATESRRESRPTWCLRRGDTSDGDDRDTRSVRPTTPVGAYTHRQEQRVPCEGPGAFADVFVTGHSLGGALACLCAYSLHRALSLVRYPRADICVYTFGQPRMGNASFRDAYNRAVPRTFRVVNESDVVSGWRVWAGHHVGVQVNIDRHGNYVCKPMAMERLLRPTSGPGLAVLNHAMLAYADSLNAVADRVQHRERPRSSCAGHDLLTREEGDDADGAEGAHEDSAQDSTTYAEQSRGLKDVQPFSPLRCLVPYNVPDTAGESAPRLFPSPASLTGSKTSPT